MKRALGGFSFVEIMVAMGIMALALVPIVSIIQHSHHQLADEKAEAAVASYASSIFNEALFKRSYDEVISESGEEEIDGTSIKWELEVAELSNLELQFQRARYHQPCAGGACSGAELLGVEQVPADQLDAKYGGGVLKTLKLSLKWRPYYQSWSDEAPNKKLVLCTRKARLE